VTIIYGLFEQIINLA